MSGAWVLGKGENTMSKAQQHIAQAKAARQLGRCAVGVCMGVGHGLPVHSCWIPRTSGCCHIRPGMVDYTYQICTRN